MMKYVLDFFHAALPWISIGLLLALFAVRSAKKKKADNSKEDYGTEGMCIGMCLGSAIGASGAVSIGISMSLGMLIGLAIGTCITKNSKSDDK